MRSDNLKSKKTPKEVTYNKVKKSKNVILIDEIPIDISPSLRSKLEDADFKLTAQINRLFQLNQRFMVLDRQIFAKIVRAIIDDDNDRGNALANELIEIRLMNKRIINAKRDLEQLTLRLRTISELNDIIVTLGPALGVLRSVRSGLVSVFPEAENELGEIGNMLSGIMVEAGQGTGMTLNFDTVNEDVSKILSEAAVIAEQKIKDKFPDTPDRVTEKSNKSSKNRDDPIKA